MKNVKLYYEKPEGRDFIVGDLHGCKDQLISVLKHINFNTEQDRLFCVGDLVDRGTDNVGMIEMYLSPDGYYDKDFNITPENVDKFFPSSRNTWFYSVIGNHESLVCNGITISGNGTEWIVPILNNKDNPHHDTLKNFIDNIETNMPFVIVLESKEKSYLITHNMLPVDMYSGRKQSWHDVYQYNYSLTHKMSFYETTLWDRYAILDHNTNIDIVDYVFHGHTVYKHPLRRGNRFYIDTGFNLGTKDRVGKLSMYEVGTDKIVQYAVDFNNNKVIGQQDWLLDDPHIAKTFEELKVE